ncbi:hypothetical protein SBRCBS47491_009714 [Sporothrix bragantina]|uniref:amidase n=1 Tax=Sporothrix bragantina TaxID=671064 RepID=A0ABP0D067_9PEZI
MPEPWEEKVAARRKVVAAQIPEEWRVTLPAPEELPSTMVEGTITAVDEALAKLMTPREIMITTAPTSCLVGSLQTGAWTAEETMLAFCKRSAIGQQALNCATDMFFDEALAKAREYDVFRLETGTTKGPLHGLPLSVKDVFDQKGKINTAGLVSRIDRVATADAQLVSIMQDAGAIPFIRTATSQACQLVESITNVYGTVMNPWNRALSAGGSSGGEGALVAFHGSPLGLGTDGGGSLRFPASWNGIYTIKPTSMRIPGNGSGCGTSDSNAAGYGPLAPDLDAVKLFCQTVLDAKPWKINPAVVPMPWNASITAPTKLKIGVLYDDGIVHNSPPVDRCLREAAAQLKAAGHEIVELGAEWARIHRDAAGVAFKMYTQEGGVGFKTELEKSGEPPIPRTCTGWTEKRLTPMEIWLNHRQKKMLRQEYVVTFNELGLDAVVTAPMPHPAPPHGEYITSAIAAVYNALDMPTTTIPFGRVDLAMDVASPAWYAETPYPDMPDFPYDRYDADMKKLYTGPEVFANAPLGLQIVTLPLTEEYNVAVAEVMDKLLNKK